MQTTETKGLTQHTPGPWRLAGKGTVRAGNGWIASVNWRNRNANACLIAAAPELLEALKYARRFLKPDDVDMAFIDAAIAKAEG